MMIEMVGTSASSGNGHPQIALTIQIWKEGSGHVAYTPELDLSSCGKTATQAKSHLREAIALFIEEASRMGTLTAILDEAGFQRHGNIYKPRPILERDKLRVTLPAA